MEEGYDSTHTCGPAAYLLESDTNIYDNEYSSDYSSDKAFDEEFTSRCGIYVVRVEYLVVTAVFKLFVDKICKTRLLFSGKTFVGTKGDSNCLSTACQVLTVLDSYGSLEVILDFGLYLGKVGVAFVLLGDDSTALEFDSDLNASYNSKCCDNNEESN